MNSRKYFILFLNVILFSAVCASCKNSQKKNDDQEVRDKIKMEFEELKEDINSISFDDEDFREKIDEFVADFNEDIDEIKSDIEKNRKNISQETKDLLKDAESKSNNIQNELNLWVQRTGEKVDSEIEKAGDRLDQFGEHFKKSWSDFKNWVDENLER